MASSALRLSFAVLLLILAIPPMVRLSLATLAQLSSARRCFLRRRYIFLAVNFVVLVVVKLVGRQGVQEMPEAETTVGSSVDSRGSGDSCPDRGLEPPASPPEAGGATVGGENTPLPADKDPEGDSAGPARDGEARATAPRLRKSKTWDAPPRVQVKTAAGREIRRSETVLHETAAYAAVRRAVAERLMKEREEERDEMNKRFNAFIDKFNEQLRRQTVASSHRRRRYGDDGVCRRRRAESSSLAAHADD